MDGKSSVESTVDPSVDQSYTEEIAARSGRSRKLKRWSLAAILFALICAGLWWGGAIAPQPAPYVSPIIDNEGTRFRMLLPARWEVTEFRQEAAGPTTRAELMLGEHNGDWRPALLARFWPRNYQLRPFMIVAIYGPRRGKPPSNLWKPTSPDSLAWKDESIRPGEKVIAPDGTVAHQTYILGRSYFTPDGAYQVYVQYHREDRAQLIPTMNSIGRTFRLSR